jgi:GrpB-like predicted nucleotidyltransferase (UPF0157 family)
VADQPIEIVNYDPRWVDSFSQQQSRLAVILAPWLSAPVQHFGSTAVPGLRSKPIVDILAPVRSVNDARHALPLLQADGWLHWPDDPDRHDRMWFLRPRPEARTHHLHVIADPARIAPLLAFRDALRNDPQLRHDYASLKTRLAQEHRTDREAYTRAKADFVARALPSPRDGQSR